MKLKLKDTRKDRLRCDNEKVLMGKKTRQRTMKPSLPCTFISELNQHTAISKSAWFQVSFSSLEFKDTTSTMFVYSSVMISFVLVSTTFLSKLFPHQFYWEGTEIKFSDAWVILITTCLGFSVHLWLFLQIMAIMYSCCPYHLSPILFRGIPSFLLPVTKTPGTSSDIFNFILVRKSTS